MSPKVLRVKAWSPACGTIECNGPLKRRGLEGEGLVTSVPLQVPGPFLSLLPGRHHSRFYPHLAMMYYLATGPKASGPLSHGLKLPKLGASFLPSEAFCCPNGKSSVDVFSHSSLHECLIAEVEKNSRHNLIQVVFN